MVIQDVEKAPAKGAFSFALSSVRSTIPGSIALEGQRHDHSCRSLLYPDLPIFVNAYPMSNLPLLAGSLPIFDLFLF